MNPVNFALIITAVLFVAGPNVRAAEVASGDSSALRMQPSDGTDVDTAEASLDDSLPTLSHLDARNRSRGASYQCRNTWNQVRNRAVGVVPVAVATSTIRANALRAGISPQNFDRTFKTYLKNQASIPNQRFISIVDFSKRSDQKRLFTIDLSTGRVESFATSAGYGSDPDGDGYADRFSNRSGSRASSLGCYLAAGEYHGNNGKSLMLHGFEDTNDNACERAVVMHPASYVGGVPGRSYGCLALKHRDVRTVYSRVGGGGLICAYHDGKTQAVGAAPARRGRAARRPRRHARSHYRSAPRPVYSAYQGAYHE